MDQKWAVAHATQLLTPSGSGLSENPHRLRESARGRVLGDVRFEKWRNRTLGALVHFPANGSVVSGGELSEHFQCARFELAQSHGEILVLLLNALPTLKTLIKLPAKV